MPTLMRVGNLFSPSMQKWPAHRRLLLPTMNRRDEKGPGPAHTKGGRDLPTDVGGHLNPTWAEWFMGFPEGWTDVSDAPEFAPSATRLSPRARK